MPNQPGQGATFMPSRFAGERRPYVFSPYPSTRYHPDGRIAQVANEQEDNERFPKSAGWRRDPYPPKPVMPAPALPTLDEVIANHAKLVEEHKALLGAYADKVAECVDLRAQLNAKDAAPAAAGKKNAAKSE